MRRGKSSLFLAIGLTVIAVLAAAVVAVATIKPFGVQSLLPFPSSPGQSVELVVSGEPPASSGNWATGVSRVWRIDQGHTNDIDGYTNGFTGFEYFTAQAWGAYDFVGDTTHLATGIDPKTGRTLWGGKSFRDCSAAPLNGQLACLGHLRKGEDWIPAIQLVDWATGEAAKSVTLDDLGLASSMSAASSLTVIAGQIVVTLPDYPNGSGDYLGELSGVQVARVAPDLSRVEWKVDAKGCTDEMCELLPAMVDWEPSVQHGILSAQYGLAIDFESGELLLPESQAGAPASENSWMVVDQSGKAVTGTIAAPDGTKLPLVAGGGWVLRHALPPAPIKVTPGAQVSETADEATLMAFDPATGEDLWAAPVPAVVQRDRAFGVLTFARGVLVVRTESGLMGLDPTSGEVKWVRAAGAADWWNELEWTADGVLLSNTGEQTVALDPATGSEYWRIDGSAAVVPDGDGGSLLVSYQQPGTDRSVLSRLVPADRVMTAPAVPADAPACPSGMSPLSWTQYAEGAILLCRAGTTYQVVMSAHPDWQAIKLEFVDGGHRVTYANGVQVAVSLGGALVTIDDRGTVTTLPASKAWSSVVGLLDLDPPVGVKACPAGSWPISLSSFDGGWLLVCGTSAGQPTSLTFADQGGVTDATTVRVNGRGYCGELSATTVCAYRSPAVISLTRGGSVEQRAVASNYFTGFGRGGTGEGTGSYGVAAPDATASDQVRYLTQVLQKSSVGRVNIDRAVAQVRACTDLAAAAVTIQSVTQNREELLSALDSAPVDAIPEGQSLVAELRHALTLARDSDRVWEQWAASQQANECADGEANPAYQQVKQMNVGVAQAKSAFLDAWNSRIAPQYGAPTFKTGQI